MKGIYCVLFLVCCTLFLHSDIRVLAFEGDSNQQVSVTGESTKDNQNARIPSWIPQPQDIQHVEEKRLLAVVKAAQHTLVDASKDATAWGALGNIYFVHGWEIAAAECYRSAVEIAPNAFRWLYYLGMTTYKTDPKTAAQALAKAIQLDPQYTPAHVYRAAALRSLGRFAQAKAHLETANALEPRNPFASLWLGELAFADQQFEAARSHLQQALKLNPEQSEAHAAMAQVAMVLGETDTCYNACTSIAETHKIHTDAGPAVVGCPKTRRNGTTLC